MENAEEIKKRIESYFASRIQEKKVIIEYEELIREAQKEADNYIQKRGGIEKIILDIKILDTAYETVKKAFNETEELEYFERRKKVIPELKKFYETINQLFSNEDCACEYEEYLKKIMLDASNGTWYPFLDEIEHEEQKEEPEKTLDNLVKQTRNKICGRKRKKKMVFL